MRVATSIVSLRGGFGPLFARDEPPLEAEIEISGRVATTIKPPEISF